MIEVFLFINPLDKESLKVEQQYLKIIEKETKEIQFRMIPLLNLRVINQYLSSHFIDCRDLNFRNQVISSTYSACLDCKAAFLQGRQNGRRFVFELQKRVDLKKNPYSKKIVYSILKEFNMNIQQFNADRKSDLVVNFFKIDQQIANEMGVEHYLEAVIFNYDSNRDFGVLVGSDTPNRVIRELFETDCINYHFSNNHDSLHL